jgi:hypothetical protein
VLGVRGPKRVRPYGRCSGAPRPDRLHTITHTGRQVIGRPSALSDTPGCSYARRKGRSCQTNRQGGRTIEPAQLTFACELSAARLTEFFADGSVIADLQALQARVTLMLSDLSSERASVVQQLNSAGIPVVAVPLLPFEEGYYFTADNAPRAESRYQEWKGWTKDHGLVRDGVGLDIEPDVRLYQQIVDNAWGLVPVLLPRLLDRVRPRRAAAAYAGLVARIQADGWRVENYQFPLIADERQAGSDLLQRVAGLVDVPTDQEVWMLYTSFLRSLGPGMICSYGPQAQAIAVGSTGGSPDIPGHHQVPTLGWEELERDLLLARRWSDDLYIHSLEGCVEQGFMERLRSLEWGRPEPPPPTVRSAAALRRLLRGILWTNAHPWRVLGAGAALAWLLSPWRRSHRTSTDNPRLN